MHPEIAKRWQKLEVGRKELVERIKALSTDKQTAKPVGGGFSAIEIPMHFALVEEYNVSFLRKHPSASLKGKRVRHGPFYGMTVNQMKDASRSVQTLSFMIPKSLPSLEEGAERWARAREAMEVQFEQVESPEAPFIKMMFFFGTLSASDYLDLLEAHQHYHSVRFPAS